MIHRYLAGTLVLLILSILTTSIISKLNNKKIITWMLCIIVIIAFQAALGMLTVTLNLLPIIVMGHLLGGIILLSLLWGLTLEIRTQQYPAAIMDNLAKPCTLRLIAIVGFILVFLQIALGGWVS